MIINKKAPSNVVKAWQSFLNTQGFSVGIPDGIWGVHTQTASEKYQSENKLSPDGIIGSESIKTAEAKGFVIPEMQEFNPPGNLNAVFDISHLNENVNLAAAKAAGMLAVFHKATQSGGATLFRDNTYPARRAAAQGAGLLWGAYHFGTGGNGTDQANEFLNYAAPDNNTLLVLDFERCTTPGEATMSVEESKAFIQQVKLKTGKYPGIYGGSLLREAMTGITDPLFSKCWLWIAQYASTPHLPNAWNDYAFWQFTDGINGPGALPIDGIGHCDRDLFRGTTTELTDFWKTNGV